MYLSAAKNAAYLVDRKFDFYSIYNSFSSLPNVLAEDGVTLLDGEMIRHLETKKFYFMVRARNSFLLVVLSIAAPLTPHILS